MMSILWMWYLYACRYLADHGHTGLHFPGTEVRVKHFNSDQLCFFVLTSEDVDQTVQLHHTKVLTSLRTSAARQSNHGNVPHIQLHETRSLASNAPFNGFEILKSPSSTTDHIQFGAARHGFTNCSQMHIAEKIYMRSQWNPNCLDWPAGGAQAGESYITTWNHKTTLNLRIIIVYIWFLLLCFSFQMCFWFKF